jgi:2-polyprenyl-3-methyl-5-hydroxy-6-metoxy-1,4-benzoquinol methylase
LKLNINNEFGDEIDRGERFEFGKNWMNFLENLTEEQIIEGEKSLKEFLNISDLSGRSFVDVGSGSGLMSLCAARLGANVFSFDYDPACVWCTKQLRSQYHFSESNWKIEKGSILDEEYIDSLGKFDIIYSWGVLHHTGNMKKAFELVSNLVKPSGGVLFIAIYNDQGVISNVWKIIKKIYCKSPNLIKKMIVIFIGSGIWGFKFLLDFLKLKPFDSWKNYHKLKRGMSPWTNVIDWVGGYPFEVAKPGEIIDYFSSLGFSSIKTKTVGKGQGNNQFVFEKA